MNNTLEIFSNPIPPKIGGIVKNFGKYNKDYIVTMTSPKKLRLTQISKNKCKKTGEHTLLANYINVNVGTFLYSLEYRRNSGDNKWIKRQTITEVN
jgi:hypothetical protein